MGKIELYTITPKGWDGNNSFLIAKKVISKLSTGKTFVGYEVVKRCSIQGYEKKLLITDSLKGMHYNEFELDIIRVYKCEDTNQNIICNGCEDCDYGFELTQDYC